MIRLYYLLRYVGWPVSQRASKNVLWVCPGPGVYSFLSYIASDAFVKDVVIMSTFRRQAEPIRWVWGLAAVGSLHDSNVMFNYHHRFNAFGFENYVNVFPYLYSQLKDQNNKIIPDIHERMLWENKVYMHEQFKRLAISHPKTLIFNTVEAALEQAELAYPLLVKEAHSCSSAGVHKVASKIELKKLLDQQDFRLRNPQIILQELLNMRRDLRVIYVGDELVLHYWRINLGHEWKPTSTGHGSAVDFFNFPEKWRSFLLKEFLKLKISTGAFDVAWQNDDLDSTPMILEVSSNYQPNAPMSLAELGGRSYGDFKKSMGLGRLDYPAKSVEIIQKIHSQWAELAIAECREPVASHRDSHAIRFK